MTTRRYLFTVFLLLLFSGSVSADAIDDYVRAEMQKRQIPGLSLAVVKDGKVIKAGGYGLANHATQEAATPETVYRIASLSKQFLASGIMLLVEEKKVGLDDSVRKYLPDAPETWQPITIRHLLTHTSGLVREAPGFNPLKVQPDSDVIKTAYNLPLEFPTGSKWQYSNVGYFILADIIAKVSGKPWGDFVTERIFRPSGMTHSWVTTTTAPVAHRAIGYSLKEDTWQPALDYKALRPSGAFLSTVLDLAKWDAALYGDTVLKRSLRDQMWTPMRLSDGKKVAYGFGWMFETYQGHRVIRHNGSQPGFLSEYTHFPDDKLTVIILTNGDKASPATIATGVATLYFAAP